MKIKISLFTLLVTGCWLLVTYAIQLAAADVRVDASVDKGSIYIGDIIKYTITAGVKDAEIEFPKIEDTLGQFAVRDAGRTKISQWASLTIYKTGKQTIPEQEVKIRAKSSGEWSSFKTNPVDIEVKSLLAENPRANDIRDIKGILHPSGNLSLNIGLMAAAICAIVLGAFLLAKRYLLKERPPKPKTAQEIAREELERIKMSAFLTEGKVKEYYFRLSTCIRHYIENRFSIKAPEMTLEEFLESMKASAVLNESQKSLLMDFLQSADMVKFAKYAASRGEAETSFDFAKRFVDETGNQDST